MKLNELLKIVETADFSLLKSIISKTDYFFSDSTVNNEGRKTYELKDNSVNGNKIWVVEYKNKIEGLSFFTNKEEIHKRFKEQLIKKGFALLNVRKGKEYLRKGEVTILATSEMIKENITEYSFIFPF
jgi:hypothetical protein